MGYSPKPFQLKVYPNGEFAVHVQRKVAVDSVGALKRTDEQRQTISAIEARGIGAVLGDVRHSTEGSALGLSTLRNLSTPNKRPARNGLKGMPGQARKMVRNACYLLERDCGRQNLSFLTLTIPDMPNAEMNRLHECWSRVVIAVRKKLTLRLENASIAIPEVVVVSEIQEKRYERTGYPVLHLHCLFQGRNNRMAWAISKTEVQQLWKETINNIVGGDADVSKATRIERVKKSAENYMGKYMSKGVTAVRAIVEDGYADWLPHQWWGMTRTLSKRIRALIRISHQSAATVWHSLLDGVKGICKWFRPVYIEAVTGEKYLIAFYGKFTTAMNNSIESEIRCT